MRYIGNKTNLLENIEEFIDENVPYYENMVFCDLFSGTSSVARYFKNKYEIISNDLLYFSYILQKSTLVLNSIPSFQNLKEKLELDSLQDIFYYLERTSLDELQTIYKIDSNDLFIYNNYTPANEECNRMYFKPKMGKRIDLIRIILNKWLSNNWINNDEYVYLLAVLIETVPFYSNISGVYGAYLKKWDNRTNKDFFLRKLKVEDNGKNNHSYNCDGHDLIKKIEGDILYLDPPYNNRQYPPNYHVLETIAKYDYPEIHGVSGMRDYSTQISKFCRKKEVKLALEDIIKNAKFKYIILSYSTDGLLSIEDIEEIFKKYGKKETYKMAKPIEYRKYMSKQKPSKKELHELLFFVEKENIKKESEHKIMKRKKSFQSTLNLFDDNLNNSDFNHKLEYSTTKNISYNQKDFLKCPFNYIGGKYKLLPQLYSNFPENTDIFVDLFGGGFNVGMNHYAHKIIYNDQLTPLVELFKYLQVNDSADIINYIENTIKINNLSKENKESYKIFRDKYNLSEIKNPLDLYILVSYSFNYQFRFNNQGEYNNPHGTNRSSFTSNMKNRLVDCINILHEKDITFLNQDFTQVDLSMLTNKSLVYCDPPYLITTGSYNDGNRGFKNWTKKEEKQLLKLLSNLDDNSIPFALSNVTIHNGKSNDILIDWIEKNNFKAISIDSDYSNSNYQKKNNEKDKNKEVLVINY